MRAAHHQNGHRVIAGGNKGGRRAVQHSSSDRVAGMDALGPVWQVGRPDTTGHLCHACGEQLVHPAQHPVLFVDHTRDFQQRRRAQRRDRGVATEAHHHIRPVAHHLHRHAGDAARNLGPRHRLGRQPTAREGGRGDLRDLGRMREPAGIARTPRVSGQAHAPAFVQHRLGQRLRGEHVTPGAACRNQQIGCAHQPRPRRMSPNSPCGRERVKASNMPTAMPPAIRDEPP